MKNKNALWAVAVVLAVTVIGAAVYFGNTSTQKGSLIRPVTGAPDLTVELVGSLNTGRTVSYIIKNIGKATAKPFYFHAIEVLNNACDSSEICSAYSYDSAVGDSLRPGESRRMDTNHSLAAIAIIVDPGNVVTESNESNNMAMWTFKAPTDVPGLGLGNP